MAKKSDIAKINEGEMAPDFELADQDGKKHKLSDYRGKKIVLYFYPKDDTPGCTIEACNFRDDISKYAKKGAMVLGVSVDSEQNHKKFSSKYKLPFTLLADPNRAVVNTYNVWKEKSFMGRKYMGTSRETFLIGEDGRILKHFRDVKTKEHSTDILSIL